MTIEPFRAAHLDEIELQPAQTNWRTWGTPDYATALEALGTAYTARAGRVIACGGIVRVERDVGHLWSFLSVEACRHLVRLHRMTLRLFETAGFARVLASTESDFTAGLRWLEMLGFQFLEALPGFGPDGRDHSLYVRVCR